MFQIAMAIGWAALLVLLLYMWADVREIERAVKENKRELLRNNFGGRTSGNVPNPLEFFPASGSQDAREEEEKAVETSRQKPLDESEEQVLKEVLTEFLG